MGVTEGEDPAVGTRQPVTPAVGRGGDADDGGGGGDPLARERPVEGGAPVAVDPAPGLGQPVTVAAGRGGQAHEARRAWGGDGEGHRHGHHGGGAVGRVAHKREEVVARGHGRARRGIGAAEDAGDDEALAGRRPFVGQEGAVAGGGRPEGHGTAAVAGRGGGVHGDDRTHRTGGGTHRQARRHRGRRQGGGGHDQGHRNEQHGDRGGSQAPAWVSKWKPHGRSFRWRPVSVAGRWGPMRRRCVAPPGLDPSGPGSVPAGADEPSEPNLRGGMAWRTDSSGQQFSRRRC